MQQKSPLCTYFFTVQQLKKKKSVNKLEFLHYAEAAQSDFKVSNRIVSSYVVVHSFPSWLVWDRNTVHVALPIPPRPSEISEKNVNT